MSKVNNLLNLMALLLLILGLVLCLYPYLDFFSMLLCLAFVHGMDTGILIPGGCVLY